MALTDFRPAVARPAVPAGLPSIAPSILSADFSRLGADVQQVQAAGCKWLHLDVMDHHFVPNLTFGAPVIKCLRPVVPDMYFDAHLMVERPAHYINEFADAGCQNITFHVEAAGAGSAALADRIRSLGINAGISVKPGTPIDTIAPLLDHVDLVLVMTVEPGFGGQGMIPSCLEKVRWLLLDRKKNKRNYLIQIDGGVNEQTIHIAAAAGTDVFVAGSAVFNKNPIADNLANLYARIRSGT